MFLGQSFPTPPIDGMGMLNMPCPVKGHKHTLLGFLSRIQDSLMTHLSRSFGHELLAPILIMVWRSYISMHYRLRSYTPTARIFKQDSGQFNDTYPGHLAMSFSAPY
jgi:hypothetical protein